MGSTPRHPFFLYVIDSLMDYDRSWGLPYITVMYTTGPLFLSVLWKKYMNSNKNVGDGPLGGRVRILMEDDYHNKPWSFFNTFRGSSWHGDDANFIFWMGDHWLLLTVLGVLAAGVAALALWWAWSVITARGRKRRLYGSRGPVGWLQKLRHWRRSGKEDYELLENDRSD